MKIRSLHTRRKPLAAQLSLALACAVLAGRNFAGSLPVTSCADDLSAGTLRVVVANAAAADTIDLDSQLACSTITLDPNRGEIATSRNLTLIGPSDRTVTIQGNGNARVFDVTSGSIGVTNLTVSGGGGVIKGGCILASQSAVLDHSTVSQCTLVAPTQSSPMSAGAGIYASSVTLTNGSIVADNQAYLGSKTKYIAYGGGVFATASFSCSDSTISGNSALIGGGVSGKGSIAFDRCTVASNAALGGGGIGVFNATGSITVKQSTISGNMAPFRGGAIYSTVALSMYNSTVVSNACSGNYAGGISSKVGITAFSSIIANNPGKNGTSFDIDIPYSATLSGANNNIIYTNTTPLPGVITVTADPQLAPLGWHGGPTRTMAPLATSPVLDQGSNPQSFTTDQRGAGFAREVAAATDIGAYERQLNDDEIFGNGFD